MKIGNVKTASLSIIPESPIPSTAMDAPILDMRRDPSSKSTNGIIANPSPTGGKTAAERNNNPFNIKYGKFAARYGATKENRNALDGGSFATFNSPQTGMKAAKALLLGSGYKNLTVDQAMKRWSNSGYGGNIMPSLSNRKISDLSSSEIDSLQRQQIIQEDRKYAKKLGYLKYGGEIDKDKAKRYNALKARYPKLSHQALLNMSQSRERGRPDFNTDGISKKLKEAKDYFTDPKVGILDKLDAVLSSPSRGVVKAITGKYQDPSEALDIKNPIAKFAVDAVLDPTNLIGAGLIGKGLKAAKYLKTTGKAVPKGMKVVHDAQAYTKAVSAADKTADLNDGIKGFKSIYKGSYGTRGAKLYEDVMSNASKATGGFTKLVKDKRIAEKVLTSGIINDLIPNSKDEEVSPSTSSISNPTNINNKVAFPKQSVITPKNKVNVRQQELKKVPNVIEERSITGTKSQLQESEVDRSRTVLNEVSPIANNKDRTLNLPSITVPKPSQQYVDEQNIRTQYKDKDLPPIEGELIEEYNARNRAWRVDNRLVKPKTVISKRQSETQLGKKKFGGYIPKYKLGKELLQDGDAMGLAGGLLAEGVDMLGNPKKENTVRSVGSGALRGAAAGASIGSMLPGIGTAIGAGAGALIGGISSGIEAERKKKELAKQMMIDQQQFVNSQTSQSNFAYKSLDPLRRFKYGGKFNPEYEVEKGEIVQGDAQLSHSKQLASNLHEVTGYTHNQNNPDTGTTGVLGSGGDRVFSHSIPFNKKNSIADEARRLSKIMGKAEKKLQSTSSITRKTGELMSQKATQELDAIFEQQEAMKVPTYKYGGELPKFAQGGDLVDLLKTEKASRARLEQINKLISNKGTDFDTLKKLGEEAKVLEKQVTQVGKKIATMRPTKVPGLVDKAIQGVKNFVGGTGKMVGKDALGQVGRGFAKYGSIAALVFDMKSDVNPNSNKAKEKAIDPVLLKKLQAEGFTGKDDRYSGDRPWDPFTPNIQQRRDGRRNRKEIIEPTLPATSKTVGGKTSKGKKETYSDKPSSAFLALEAQKAKEFAASKTYTGANTITRKPTTSNLGTALTDRLDKTNPSDISKGIADTARVRGNGMLDNDKLAIGMNALTYLNTQNAIRRTKTNVAANLTQMPNYGYKDNSRLAQYNLDSKLNQVSNGNLNPAQRQEMFGKFLNAGNEIQNAEVQNKMNYDDSFGTRSLQVEAQNNLTLNNAKNQETANKNAVTSASAANFTNLFGNINTILAEKEARKLDLAKSKMISDSFVNMYGTNFQKK